MPSVANKPIRLNVVALALPSRALFTDDIPLLIARIIYFSDTTGVGEGQG